VKPGKVGQIAIPAAVVLIVVMMVIPLPSFVLDMLLAFNITAAVLVLLVSMNIRKPLDFSIFPTLLLILTLFRLALNVSATRLVLTKGDAGKVIDAFGHFVVGGSIVVGLVIFFILVIIQFMVITKGAERVAEVAARFTLDALPGKQMAIDADLNAGIIDENQARRRRQEVSMEADFYGAMDGASKFVKGDAIAAIVITFINLLGGFVVGVVQAGLPIAEAIEKYSLLSVGDGLVSQIPALLISISTGIVVTRAATENDLGTDLLGQLGAQTRPLKIAAIAVCLLALIPALPKPPFLIVGGALFLIATRLGKIEDEVATAEEEAAGGGPGAGELPAPSPDSPEALAGEMRVEPLELEVAYDLIDLVDPARGGDLLDRVRALRRKLAAELGVVIPPVRTRDNVNLPPSSYVIRVHGVELAQGEAPPGSILVIGDDLAHLPGVPTQEPVFGLAAKWVPLEMRQQAEMSGLTAVDRSSVITTHMAEVVRTNAGRMLSRSDVKQLVDMVRASDPIVVEELTPATLTLGEIQRVLASLLDENVAIRDLVRIFEALGERARLTKDPESLIESARGALGPAISAQYAVEGRLPLLTLDPMVEHAMLEALRMGDQGSFLAMDPERAERLALDVARKAEDAEQRGEQSVLVCSAQLRPALRRLVRTAAPRVPVLSYTELGPQLQLETVGVVTFADAPV
jgi:flagellar biosynthesis protein FlhA